MKLGVNVDHVATLRQARGGRTPDPVEAARLCEKVGAHSIVMHLREDRRHIQDEDLFRAQKSLSIKLNLEMSIAPSVVKVARRLRPDQVTLVPEKRMERTTEGGLDLSRKKEALKRVIRGLEAKNVEVSLFIDPDARQIETAKALAAPAVEFHTGDYANAASAGAIQKELKRLDKAVRLAGEYGIKAHAGHGLDYHNVKAIRRIKGLEELNIGYSIVCRAVWVGWENAVQEMLDLIR
ncbi:MAG: pyridoxine 5'-phosphate synthase [Candidatus Omnitrophica bacterium]|nr:pyridoxine 5'-phosphate synthase [Candidatus Omnitrophota bacterium]